MPKLLDLKVPHVLLDLQDSEGGEGVLMSQLPFSELLLRLTRLKVQQVLC